MADEWYTPKWVFDALGLYFDLDVASPCDYETYVPAREKFCKCDDALQKQWTGLVFMNPPYSNPKPFVEKWLDHGNGIALLPMAKSRWFNDLFQTNASFVLLPSNLKFESPDKKPLSLMMGATLWAVGYKAVESLKTLNFGKVR